jgi:hypothetical protein
MISDGVQSDDGKQNAVNGPWRCLPGCTTHHGGHTGDDKNGECCASEHIGLTELSEHRRGMELEVAVDQFATGGVCKSATIAILVQPQGACDDGVFVLTVDEARQHIRQLQAAVTAAAATDDSATATS